jgi:hypothetical protein
MFYLVKPCLARLYLSAIQLDLVCLSKINYHPNNFRSGFCYSLLVPIFQLYIRITRNLTLFMKPLFTLFHGIGENLQQIEAFRGRSLQFQMAVLLFLFIDICLITAGIIQLMK